MSVPRMEIYQFEKALSLGVATVLLANGLNDPKRQQQNDNLFTPRVELKVVCSGNIVAPGRVHRWIKQDDKSQWIDAFTGTLFAKTVTRRKASPEQDHQGILGTVRHVLQAQRQSICDAMPFHSVLFPQGETGSTPTIDQGNMEDGTSLSYPFIMRIMFPEKSAKIFIS